MKIERVWAMPSADTFDIAPISQIVKRYLRQSRVSIDPFARNKRWATYTNDLNPETAAEYHMDALEFLEMLRAMGVKVDLIILDPPYSMHQQTVSYGHKTQIALTAIYDLAYELLVPDGISLSFGFNSNGLGRGRKCEVLEIHLVAHGGHHNDTIVTVERKIAHQPDLFAHS